MPRKRGRRPDPRVKERQAFLLKEMYAALETEHGLILSSLTPSADEAFCRARTNDQTHPRLAALVVRRDPKNPDEIHLARID
jgi:hypothetical protein